jgi:small subunit ribosomal protein S3
MKERKFISNNVNKLLVTEYIKRETDTAGFAGIEMKRTPFGMNISLSVNKPGLVIGRHGSKVQEITETLSKKYGVESPQIEVKEVENPDLNPQVVARKIALSLEKGWSYRKAGNTSLRRIIDAGTRGVMIKIGGKISGERARSQKFMFGSIKYSGEPARSGMDNGFAAAKLKLGIIGVSVKMLRNSYRLPDDIKVNLQNKAAVSGVKIEENENNGTESKETQRNE